jgi:murein DD-endopeptidase MepM/ murein hydrolase activator NlpD
MSGYMRPSPVRRAQKGLGRAETLAPSNSGADVDRRNQTTTSSLYAGLRGAAAALSTTDGRWAVVSTSLTAIIAGSLAWLAAGTTPVTSGHAKGRDQSFPYELFKQYGASYASLGPTGGQTASREDSDPTAVDPSNGIDTRNVTMDSGDTLAGLLTENGISMEEATTAIAAMRDSFNPRDIRAGQNFDMEISTLPAAQTGDASTDAPVVHLLSLHFSPNVEQDITLTRGADGTFAVNNVQKKLEAHTHRAGTTIDSSLYLAAMQAGIPADVVVEMIRMFSYKVDFQRDIHPGDSFEVFYDYYYTPEGQPARPGNITYALMRLGGQDIALYRYQTDPKEPAEYFDASGQSAKGLLMKTPVDGARISSGFGMRFHPVLGYTRMHKGIDFAVPKGTPVMAAGNGTVIFEGVASGYGNFMKVSHGNGYATGYGHLSRFAPGIKNGSRVRQGQVIAYSGMTGVATGPHLHYEIFQNGGQVNPLKVKFAQGRKLTGGELRNYLVERLHVDAKMASMKLETKVADVSADLRQAKK